MKDAEHEHISDDLDVEISDLPGMRADDDGQGSVEQGDGDKGDRKGRPYHIRLPFKSLLSPRQRAVQLIGTVGIVLLTLLIILGSSASIRDIVVVRLFGPTPTPSPTPVPTSNLFYIQGIPSWATTVIDGHTIAHLPRIRGDPPLRLASGRHLITWQAYPFLPQSCSLTVPLNFGTNTCLSTSMVQTSTVQLSSETWAWVITFSVSLNALATDQRAALLNSAQVALDALQSTEIVQPSEQYARAQSTPRIDMASEPLRATLRFQLDTSNDPNKPCVTVISGHPCTYGEKDCRQFCSAPGPALSSPSEQEWNVLAVIHPRWTYMTSDGRVVASDQPDTNENDASSEYLTDLDIVWSSKGWQVSVIIFSTILPSVVGPACASAQRDIGMNEYYGTIKEGNFSESVTWTFISGSNSAMGCLAVGTPRQESSLQPNAPRLPVAYILHRFGVSLAANDAARSYFPSILVANAYERHVVQELVALLPS